MQMVHNHRTAQQQSHGVSDEFTASKSPRLCMPRRGLCLLQRGAPLLLAGVLGVRLAVLRGEPEVTAEVAILGTGF